VNLTVRDLQSALDYAGRLRDSARSVSHQGEYVMGTVAQQATSGLSALGYGFLLGRYGEIKVGALSADLLGGAALHGAGLLGVFGRHAGHAHNAAQGLLDGYLQRVGIGLGARMQEAKAQPAQPRVSGSATMNPSYRFGGAKPEPLTVAQVVAMADGLK
jgi:hypothetical protein